MLPSSTNTPISNGTMGPSTTATPLVNGTTVLGTT
ncbi:unnamed protein product, partial [Rotaria magnacalcarata]